MKISTDLIIVTISVLVLIGYLFEITYRKFRIPSIIVLIVSGVLIKWFLSRYFHVDTIPMLDVILGILGTIGLILIVLEGTLELKIRSNNLNLIRDGFVFALLEMILITLILSTYIINVKHFEWYQSVVNILPFAVMSSAVAIPASQLLNKGDKFFVIYQSSFSDVLGVLFFNFFVLNEVISWGVVGKFFLQIVLLLMISVIASVVLSFLLNRIRHKIKFIPIIVMMLLFYSALHYHHLPSLLFIMIFGLLLANFEFLSGIPWFRKLNIGSLESEVRQFDELVSETTFVIKSLFFLLLGFRLNISNLLDFQAFSWAVGIVMTVLGVRFFIIKFLKIGSSNTLMIFPRGLITILLYYLLPPQYRLPYFNDVTLTYIIFISLFFLILNNWIFHTKVELSDV
ncbi:MAG: hypothetical protein Fur0023_11920 [Bacteroidia bacterium]